ncbi:MAG: hypothetical protein SGBAC_011163 [Bacillariaceae sp.]
MHLSLASTLLLISICNIDAFSSSSAAAVRRTPVTSTSNLLYATVQAAVEEKKKDDVEIRLESWAQKCGYEFPDHVSPLTGEEINARRDAQLQKMRMKDKTSTFLEKEDLKIVYEDKDIVVVDKPSGVLTVAGKDKNIPSLAQAVYEALGDKVDLPSADHMVVHRLGMDTSGLIVLAKNIDAVRALNGSFRERKVERKYEALVVGHVGKDEGLISLPIMRDYENPPYVRISTDDHQWALVHLDPEVVGKKILELPKASITKYEVVSREEYNGQPVTRVKLTSISGRYHQLNVHMSAFGHPIVGDTVYGCNGVGVTNGGLIPEALEALAPNPQRASDELQWAIAKESSSEPTCAHAKVLKFRHPTDKSKKTMEFTTDSPF